MTTPCLIFILYQEKNYFLSKQIPSDLLHCKFIHIEITRLSAVNYEMMTFFLFHDMNLINLLCTVVRCTVPPFINENAHVQFFKIGLILPLSRRLGCLSYEKKIASIHIHACPSMDADITFVDLMVLKFSFY